MKPTKLIEKYGKDKRYWYVDVLGMTLDGKRSHYMSGNIMPQNKCGYGGFHSYKECLDILENFAKKVHYSIKDIVEYSSEGFDTFVPLKASIYFAPIEDGENVYIESIVL